MTTSSDISVNTQLWDAVRSDFETLFPAEIFQTWFSNLVCRSETDDVVVLEAPNDFARIWIEDNYQDIIARRLEMAAGRSVSVSIRASTREETPAESVAAPRVNRAVSVKSTPPSARYILNPKNTFENYVVGPGNRFACAACIAVSDAPAKAYNPLFLYGDTGLGKTHLMHAVAHHALQYNPNSHVAYVSTEKFTNEFIQAIQQNTLLAFRRRYREVDVLLIDDVQFLSGKERSQEELFYTFNELFEANKQIFISSDRPASEIAKLESRLISRFQWGLVTDIQPPDLETRVAILDKKARAMKLELAPEIILFLAERVSRNIRRMEGALTRVAGFAALMRSEVTLERVEELLQDIIQEEAMHAITMESIQKRVAEFHHIQLGDMVSRRRPANIAFARQVAMYLCRVLTKHSLQEIGRAFGGRDHGTVLHACRVVENMMEQDESVRRGVEYLQKQLAKSS